MTEASKLAAGRGSITKYIRYNKGQEIPDTGRERDNETERERNKKIEYLHFFTVKITFLYLSRAHIVGKLCFFLFLFLRFGFPY